MTSERSKRIAALMLVLWGILFSALLQGQPLQTEMALLDNAKRFKIGDRLWYYVIEEREQPRVLFVNDRGYVDVPYIGEVPALGRTAKELAYQIKARLEVDFFHQATVHISQQLGENVRGEFTILGEVREPGKHKIPSDQIFYVSDAVLAAGNFSMNADTDAVTVVRQDPKDPNAELRFIVDVGGIMQTGKYEYDMPIQPNDLILVPKLQHAGGQVYITGEVKTPGLYTIPNDQTFTVSRAILAAGGFTEWARADKVKLIRATDELSPEERTLIVDVQRILEDNIHSFDPVVKPGDVIRVEEKLFKF